MFAIGAVVFGMGLGQAPVALFVLTVAVVLLAVCIGLAAAFRVLPNLAALLAIALATFGIAVWRFRHV